MGKYASEVVKLAKSWKDRNEADGSHKHIVDIYNSRTPRARGYKVKYTDAWCATTTSALAIALGYTDIIPVECSCYYLIEQAKKMGIWVEADDHIPNEGEFTLYDWDDNGKGDNKGAPEHVGTVTEVNEKEGYFIVTEGNYSNAVKDRKLSINGKYIRGFICPKYDAEPKPTPQPQPKPQPKPTQSASKKSDNVRDFQNAAVLDGFTFPKYGVDGDWGDECKGVASKAVVKCRYEYVTVNGKRTKKAVYKYRNLTKIVQRKVGVKVDGKCGEKTKAAIVAFQHKHGLKEDGCCGLNTWRKILGI